MNIFYLVVLTLFLIESTSSSREISQQFKYRNRSAIMLSFFIFGIKYDIPDSNREITFPKCNKFLKKLEILRLFSFVAL